MNAILLAAGMSQRYGHKNKLLEPYSNDKTIIGETISQLTQIDGLNIAVVLGNDSAAVRKHLDCYTPYFVINEDYKSGMVSSVKKGLSFFKNTSPFIICMGDMPNIKTSNYLELIQYHSKCETSSTIIRPIKGSKIGNPVLISSDLKHRFLCFSGKTNFFVLFQELRSHFKPYQTLASCFFEDVDTQNDYKTHTQQGIRRI